MSPLLSFEDFETYVPNPKTLDIRPHLKPQLIRYIENMPDAGSCMFGPEYHIFQQAIKLANFRERTANTSDMTARKDDPAKIYKDRLKALDRSTPSARGDFKLAKVLFYWLFREIREPSYFREVARKVWPNTSLTFARFIYAKCGGQSDDSFEQVSERFNASAGIVTRKFEEIWASEKPPFEIGIPSKVDQLYHYTDTTIEVLGREVESAALERFRDAGAGFRWWQLAGSGGQGKSRLALNLVTKTQENNPEWNAGFFLPHNGDAELKKFSEISHTWIPKENHLFVVDYVLARTEYLRKVLKDLSARASEFQHAVCLLIVERQPWHFGGIEGNANDCAEWYAKISDHRCGKNAALDCCRYTPAEETNFLHCLELRALKRNKLIEIVLQVAKLGPSPVGWSNTQIDERLHEIDSQGRPIYAFFLGRAIGEGAVEFTANQLDLLSWVLRTDLKYRWSTLRSDSLVAVPGIGSFSSEIPEYPGKNASMHLAVAATIIGELDCNEISEWFEKRNWVPHNAKIVGEAKLIADNPVCDDPEPTILGLEPDLLGEFFVIESIRKQKRFLRLLDLCWSVNPTRVVDFLSRVARDFSNLPTTREIIDHPVPEGSRHKLVEYSTDIALCWGSKSGNIPNQLAHAHLDAVEQGDPKAMSTLGVAFLEGAGVTKNVSRAINLLTMAAEKDDPIAFEYLGSCYLSGVGVPKSVPEAKACFYLGLEGGRKKCASRLGAIFLDDSYGSKNLEKAAHFFEVGHKMGDILSTAGLAEMYSQGIFYEKDLTKSCTYFHDVISSGETTFAKKYIELRLAGFCGREAPVLPAFQDPNVQKFEQSIYQFILENVDSSTLPAADDFQLAFRQGDIRDVFETMAYTFSCREVREQNLIFLPRTKLVELVGPQKENSKLVFSLLVNPHGCMVLSGSGSLLNTVSEFFLDIASVNKALDFLSFYGIHARENGNPIIFHTLGHDEYMKKEGALDPTMEGDESIPKLLSRTEDGSYVFDLSFCNQGQLGNGIVVVQPNGAIGIGDRYNLRPSPLVDTVFCGPIRLESECS